MDGQLFDDLTRTFAMSSRRTILKAAIVGLIGGVPVAVSRRRVAARNVDCAHFCRDIFAPGSDRGACISAAAKGGGPCHACGPAAPPNHPPLCGTVCCNAGEACCDGVCTDLTTEGNCGACGIGCPEGAVCAAGVCRCAATGEPPCGDVCCDADRFCNPTTATCQGCPPHLFECGISCCDATVGEVCPEDFPICCRPEGIACGADTDCCTENCGFGDICQCRTPGDPCRFNGTCCSGTCDPATERCACAPIGGSCRSFLDCCAGSCDVDVTLTCFCRREGDFCGENADCCTNHCGFGNTCQCRTPGDPCEADVTCCSGICDLVSRRCLCGPIGASCRSFLDCCAGNCDVDVTQTCVCRTAGDFCRTGDDCCSGSCTDNLCA